MEQKKQIVAHAKNIFKPKPLLTGTEWANKYFYLSPESSSAPGRVENISVPRRNTQCHD